MDNQYFLVFRDNILLVSRELPYDKYELAKEVYEILALSSFGQCSEINDKKKYFYKISFNSAEGIAERLIRLTKDEAKIVKYAMKTDNWFGYESDADGTCVNIDVDHPSECKDNKNLSILIE